MVIVFSSKARFGRSRQKIRVCSNTTVVRLHRSDQVAMGVWREFEADQQSRGQANSWVTSNDLSAETLAR